MKPKIRWEGLSKAVFTVSACLYFLVGLVSGFLGWRNSDCEWISGIASQILTLNPYSYYRLAGIAPPLGQSLGYPPLLLFLITPFVLLGRQFSWSLIFIGRLYEIPLLIVDILNVYLVIQFIVHFRPRISWENLNLIILILFFSGYFLYASSFMGHPETLVVFFSLLGLKVLVNKKSWLSGLFFGLALSAKQSALFILIPTLLSLLYQKKGFQLVFKIALATILTFSLITAPFFLTHPKDTWDGIFKASQRLIIKGPNFWWLLQVFSRRVLGWEIELILIQIANPILLLLIFGQSLFFLNRKKIKIPDIGFLGLITITVLLANLFSKWLSFHHFLLGFVMIMIWDTVRSKIGFPVFGVTYALILLSLYFASGPLWELLILLTNLAAFSYVFFELVFL